MQQSQPSDRKSYRGAMHTMQKELMVRWYAELDESVDTGKPAVYLMVSGNCVELLHAFDVLPVYPEINALQLAIRNQSLPALLKSEELGYATDNCGYVKADIGAYVMGDKTTLGTRMPKPSLILCNYVGCNTYVKWFEHLAELTGAPLYILDIPFMRQEQVSKEDLLYVVRQLGEVIALLEGITGKKLNHDELEQCVRNARIAEELWHEVRNFTKAHPSPYDAYFDSTTMMGPLYVYRGRTECIDFFQATIDEFQERKLEGTGAVMPEKFRLVVEGPPPYPYFRVFREMLAKWGACAVASTYSTVGGIWEFGFRHDPATPLHSIAEHMISQNLANRNFIQRYAQIRRYAQEWSADALLIHSVKSCRLFSAGQGDMREYFSRQLNIPTLFVESDLEDPRYFSAAQMQNRIDAFFEALEHQKFYKSHQASYSGGSL
jgi:benzoyl-CoA reductase subunit B